MKLIFPFLLAGMLIIHAEVSSQVYSLSFNNTPLRDVIRSIEKQGDYRFFFSDDVADFNQSVEIDVTNASIDKILNIVLTSNNLGYRILENNLIIITPYMSVKQGITIVGSVTDDAGDPLPGVNVLVKGSTIGVVTDVNGRYTINVPDNDAILVYSFIGYISHEQSVADQTLINISMVEDTRQIEEIVVIGYGTQKKVNLTGAVSRVSGDEMVKRPITNPVSMLQGQVAGLRVIQGLGQPGNENITLRIRGQGTFSSAGSDPLVLINGVPGDLSNLDPSIIESVSVLKDAASASIYGARAANGVVLVTTKRGAGNRKTKITYQGNFGFHSPTKMFDLVTNSAEYMGLANLAKTNSGLGNQYPQEEIDKYKQYGGSVEYPNFDWIDYMFNTAFVQNHNISMAGSSEKMTYNVALNYVNQEGTLRGFKYKKYNFSLDLTSQVTKWMRSGAYVSGKYGDKKQTRQNQDDALLSTMSQAPTYMPWLPDDGSGVVRYTNSAYSFESHNKNMPAIIATRTTRPNWDFDINAQLWAEINLLKGLIWHTKAAARLFSNKQKDWRGKTEPIYMYHTGERSGELDKGGIGLTEKDERLFYTNLFTYLKYDFSLAEKIHSFSLMAGYSQEEEKYQSLQAYRRDYPFDLMTIDAGGETGWSNRGDEREWALMSGFGRFNYNFKDRYLVEANARFDASSRLFREDRWGIFPSFSAGWRLTEEEFIKNAHISWLSNAKIRGSWGQLGNQNIGNYPYQAIINKVSAYYFDKKTESLAFIQTAYANKNIKWERTTSSDLGADIQFFNRLNVTFDWYVKTTKDILRNSQVSYLLGLEAPIVNNGTLENRGVEFSLSWTDVLKSGILKNLAYNASFNIDHSKNKLIKFGDVEYGNRGIRQEGLPYEQYYMLENIGVFADAEEIAKSPKQFNDNVQPGDLKYRDADGNGIIDNNDRVPLPGRFPKLEYSFNLGASWKGFDLSVLGQGISGKKYYITDWGVVPFRQGSSPTRDYLKGMWTEENSHGAKHPKLYWDNLGGNKNTRNNTYFLRNASYFRLKNITLGYTVPKNITEQTGMEVLRVYFSTDNIATITRFDGLDPERSGDGRAAQYPQNKIISFGINVEF